jgi:FtsZ-binding cell division protein ZapB
MQVALKTFKKRLAAAPSHDIVVKAHEMEGALKQAVKDYQMLLGEMGKLRSSLHKREQMVTALQQQLDATQLENMHLRCVWGQRMQAFLHFEQCSMPGPWCLGTGSRSRVHNYIVP